MSGFLTVAIMTIIVELPIVIALMGKKNRSWNLVAVIALINVATNLPLNLIIQVNYYLWFMNHEPLIMILETIVVVVEALLYRYSLEEKLSKCFVVSLIANVVSYFVGVFLWIW